MNSRKFSPMVENMRYYWASPNCPHVWFEGDPAIERQSDKVIVRE